MLSSLFTSFFAIMVYCALYLGFFMILSLGWWIDVGVGGKGLYSF